MLLLHHKIKLVLNFQPLMLKYVYGKNVNKCRKNTNKAISLKSVNVNLFPGLYEIKRLTLILILIYV